MTIQSQLDQVLALAEKATPGPWVVVTGKNISVGPCPGQRVALCNYDNGPIERANAQLIAQAVNFLREHSPAIRAAVGGEAVTCGVLISHDELKAWRELVDISPSQVQLEISAMLSATPQSAPSGEGVDSRLVPFEPPSEVIERICQVNAGNSIWPDDYDPRAQSIRRERAYATYAAVLATAATPRPWMVNCVELVV